MERLEQLDHRKMKKSFVHPLRCKSLQRIGDTVC
jgi:hypothetical protein